MEDIANAISDNFIYLHSNVESCYLFLINDKVTKSTRTSGISLLTLPEIKHLR